MNFEFVVYAVLIAIFAAGACTMIYAVYRDAMYRVAQMYYEATGSTTSMYNESIRSINAAWECMNVERATHSEHVKALLHENQLLFQERREELTKIHASIEKARIHLIKDMADVTGRVVHFAEETGKWPKPEDDA